MSEMDIGDTLLWHGELPIPDWPELKRRVSASLKPSEAFETWTEIARDWLRYLSDACQNSYVFTESANCLTFGPDDPGLLRSIARTAETTRQALLGAMPGLAAFTSPGKIVVLSWYGIDHYYNYVSAYYPDGASFGGSSGLQIRVGYPHIALCHVRADQTTRTVAHEMTHASLHGLDLPQWIDEGMAQLFENDYSGNTNPQFEVRDVEKTRRYWRARGLSAFWSGDGFHAPGKLQGHAYRLAEILIRLLFAEHAPSWFGFRRGAQLRLLEFLKAAKPEDAGQSAAEEHLGFGLESLAERFLGPGDWIPAVGE